VIRNFGLNTEHTTFDPYAAISYMGVRYKGIPDFLQDAQLSQRDRAAVCVIVFAKSRTPELGDNDLQTL